jgi:hypothetical protein
VPALVALGSWLLGHQAIAAAIGIYLGAAAAGVDLVDKAIELKAHVQAESRLEQKQEAAEGAKP